MLSLDRRQQRSIDQQNTLVSVPVSTIRGPRGEPVVFPVYRTPPVRVPSLDEIARDMPGFPLRTMSPVPKPLVTTSSPGKMHPRPSSPSVGRRTVVHIAISLLLLFITSSALIAVFPAGVGAEGANPLLPIIHLIAPEDNTKALIAAQVATATAVTQDGYDPGGQQVYHDVQPSYLSSPSSAFAIQDADNVGRFFYGQCTYWSNMRYRQLTRHWVPWPGSAFQWAYDGPAYGWVISAYPNPNGPSIIVLAPYTQGSGRFGHVAVVENAVTSATNGVLTSNWNWHGHWAALDWVRFYPGPGVSFLWYPNS